MHPWRCYHILLKGLCNRLDLRNKALLEIRTPWGRAYFVHELRGLFSKLCRGFGEPLHLWWLTFWQCMSLMMRMMFLIQDGISLIQKMVADVKACGWRKRASTWKIGRGIPSMLGEKHLTTMLAFPLRLCPKRIRICLSNYSPPSCCTWKKEMEIPIDLWVSKAFWECLRDH